MFSLDARNSRKDIGNKMIEIEGGKNQSDPLIIKVNDIQSGGNQEIKIPWVDPKPILAAVEQRMTQLKTQLGKSS